MKNQQQSEKVNSTNDSRSGNGTSKLKGGSNKKDHWASAKQHFIHSQEDEEEEESSRVIRDDKDKEKRRRRRKNGAGGGGGGGSSENNDYGVSGIEGSGTGLVLPSVKTRCVPRKLPLKSLNNGNQHKQQSSSIETTRTRQIGVNKTLVNSDEFKNYWDVGNKRNELTNNSSRRISRGDNSGDIIVKTDNKITLPPGWANQWQPTVDDVQPCSSKTLDPYPFP